MHCSCAPCLKSAAIEMASGESPCKLSPSLTQQRTSAQLLLLCTCLVAVGACFSSWLGRPCWIGKLRSSAVLLCHNALGELLLEWHLARARMHVLLSLCKWAIVQAMFTHTIVSGVFGPLEEPPLRQSFQTVNAFSAVDDACRVLAGSITSGHAAWRICQPSSSTVDWSSHVSMAVVQLLPHPEVPNSMADPQHN